MNTRNLETGLSLLVAILVFVAMTFAANSALADTHGVESALVADNAPLAADSKSRTMETIRKAADDAADRIARDNKLDLEIRLVDRTSTTAARGL